MCPTVWRVLEILQTDENIISEKPSRHSLQEMDHIEMIFVLDSMSL